MNANQIRICSIAVCFVAGVLAGISLFTGRYWLAAVNVGIIAANVGLQSFLTTLGRRS